MQPRGDSVGMYIMPGSVSAQRDSEQALVAKKKELREELEEHAGIRSGYGDQSGARPWRWPARSTPRPPCAPTSVGRSMVRLVVGGGLGLALTYGAGALFGGVA